MSAPREKLRLVAGGHYLYAIGGLSPAGQSLSTVERYDPRSNSWQTIASMHQQRTVPGATLTRVETADVLVVVGGGVLRDFTLVEALRTTEVYDLATGRWHVLRTELPEGRVSLGSATEADGAVLAIGGGASGVPTKDVLALTL